ncbi:MAG: U32 family peptidase [Bacillota bacterium]
MRYNLAMELLAPAGNLEKLKTAVRFGADAVYCGAGSFSLRAPEASFNLENLAQGIRFAHEHGSRVYLAMNIFPFDQDFEQMFIFFKQAVEMGIDAVIVSDPGVLARVRRLYPSMEIHLSTQANTTNSESVMFWRDQGVRRIIMARELSLAQIKGIKEKVPEMELEAFVHGAMCIAYSGRCLLSQFLTKRSANRGLCTHPCRWEYRLKEAGREEELAIHEDEWGSYILNSRDLCMIEHIPELAASGLDGLKIEGRMKTAYYVAAVTRVYRAAIDSYFAQGEAYQFNPKWLEELAKVPHRPYTTGFYLPGKNEEAEYTLQASPIRNYNFVGTVETHDPAKEKLIIEARNRFAVGEVLEILDPDRPVPVNVKVEKITNERDGSSLEQAHNSYLVSIPFKNEKRFPVSRHSIIRANSAGE